MSKKIEICGIASLLGLYLLICLKYFWIYPAPSDQLEYVQSVQWGTTVGGYWPWLDRISMASILGFLDYIPLPAYQTAPALILLMGMLAFGVTSFWLLKKHGFGASIFFLVFILTSYYPYLFGTEVFPEPFIVFFLALFIVVLDGFSKKPVSSVRKFFGGFLLALATFCKITVIPFAGLSFLYLAYIYRKKFWPVFYGAIFGLCFICLHFIFIYGWVSFQDVFVSFIDWNFKFMLKGIRTANNIVSYYETFTDRGFLPVFLALLTYPGIYKNSESRKYATIAWILGGTVCFIYLVGDRSGAVIVNYVYPMYFFGSLALAICWGSLLQLESVKTKVFLIGALLFSMALAWVLGHGHYTSEYFIMGYHREANFLIKSLLQVGVFALALSPLVIALKPTPWVSRGVLLVVCFFSFLYNGGRANSRFSRSLIPEVVAQYSNAPLINKVPVDEFLIYNSRWIPITRIERMLTVYTHFFNEKYPVPESADRQKIMMEEIPNKVGVVSSLDQIKDTKKEYILTDKVEEIQGLFPGAKTIEVIQWEGQDLDLLKIQ